MPLPEYWVNLSMTYDFGDLAPPVSLALRAVPPAYVVVLGPGEFFVPGGIRLTVRVPPPDLHVESAMLVPPAVLRVRALPAPLFGQLRNLDWHVRLANPLTASLASERIEARVADVERVKVGEPMARGEAVLVPPRAFDFLVSTRPLMTRLADTRAAVVRPPEWTAAVRLRWRVGPPKE